MQKKHIKKQIFVLFADAKKDICFVTHERRYNDLKIINRSYHFWVNS